MHTRIFEEYREQVAQTLSVFKNNNYSINTNIFKLKNGSLIPKPNDLLGVDLFDEFKMNMKKLSIFKKKMNITNEEAGVTHLFDRGVAAIDEKTQFDINYFGEKEWDDEKIHGFNIKLINYPFSRIAGVDIDSNNVRFMTFDYTTSHGPDSMLRFEWSKENEIIGLSEQLNLDSYNLNKREIHRVTIQEIPHMLYAETQYANKYFLDAEEISQEHFRKIAHDNNVSSWI